MIELEQAMDALMRVSEENVVLAAENDRLREALAKVRDYLEAIHSRSFGEQAVLEIIRVELPREVGQ
jgi:regulator of replication initiation timing